jgi:hypothetical protein
MLKHKFGDDDLTFFKILLAGFGLAAIFIFFLLVVFSLPACHGDLAHDGDVYSEGAHEEIEGFATNAYYYFEPLDINVNPSWHDDYIRGNCGRCPECCVSELWDGGADEDVTDEDADAWNDVEGDRADIEDILCTEDDCPGDNCPCVKDADGVWWLDATLGE